MSSLARAAAITERSHTLVARAAKDTKKKAGFNDTVSGVPVFGWLIIGVVIGIVVAWGLSYCYWHQSKGSKRSSSAAAYGYQ